MKPRPQWYANRVKALQPAIDAYKRYYDAAEIIDRGHYHYPARDKSNSVIPHERSRRYSAPLLKLVKDRLKAELAEFSLEEQWAAQGHGLSAHEKELEPCPCQGCKEWRLRERAFASGMTAKALGRRKK